MEDKQKKMLGFVLAGIVLIGAVLAFVGLFLDVVTAADAGTSLFDEGWDAPGMPSRAFTIVAFIVTIIGALALIVNAVLKLFVKKEIKMLGMIGGIVTVVGAVLILIAGLVLAGDFDDIWNAASNLVPGMPKMDISAGVGIWLGFIGGLIAGAAGIVSSLKALN